MSYDTKLYRTAPWRRFRERFLRLHPWCAMCGQPADVVDHIIRREAGGADLDPLNCQAACYSCHNRKTRVHDQLRKHGTYEAKTPGSNADGTPTARDHHWNK
jgi:5-methylcytosine-specific restriction endonuclease McrA